MGSKISKSDITLTREQELDIRQRAAAFGTGPSRCEHFAPGSFVKIAHQAPMEVIAADQARLTLTLRAQDGTITTLRRAGS